MFAASVVGLRFASRSPLVLEADLNKGRDLNSGKLHVDIWMGSSVSDGGRTLNACENKLTISGASVIRNPAGNLHVDGEQQFRALLVIDVSIQWLT